MEAHAPPAEEGSTGCHRSCSRKNKTFRDRTRDGDQNDGGSRFPLELSGGRKSSFPRACTCSFVHILRRWSRISLRQRRATRDEFDTVWWRAAAASSAVEAADTFMWLGNRSTNQRPRWGGLTGRVSNHREAWRLEPAPSPHQPHTAPSEGCKLVIGRCPEWHPLPAQLALLALLLRSCYGSRQVVKLWIDCTKTRVHVLTQPGSSSFSSQQSSRVQHTQFTLQQLKSQKIEEKTLNVTGEVSSRSKGSKVKGFTAWFWQGNKHGVRTFVSAVTLLRTQPVASQHTSSYVNAKRPNWRST